MNIFTRFFSKYYNKELTRKDIERDLITRESAIGRGIIGPIPSGTKREFFCLDETTWVWHEEVNGTIKVTQYLIKQTEIVKSVNDGQYERLSMVEAERFYKATKIYAQKVDHELYQQLQVI